MPLLIGLIVGSALVPASQVAAEVLVMTDGSRVETQGPFTVDGRKITFHTPTGVFSVVRASEVDLEATELANQPAAPEAEKPVAEPQEPPKSVLVLTHANIGRASDDVISPRITMYMTDWCPACHKAKDLFNRLGVPFTSIDVEKVPGASAKKKEIDPNCGVPVIVYGKESMCGLEPKRVKKWVAEMNKPEEPLLAEDDGARDPDF